MAWSANKSMEEADEVLVKTFVHEIKCIDLLNKK